ncbi:isochorismatase family protein [Corallincola luteus]|uniref:Isochorismatase family protein n=1 Tax=Corallincola luteus TaxID=1775177 RepID=A0ABY2AND9_9GAMM|nr:isochorismatase family protein [Corallincola luteus]TCI04715.1 isochorismatase family protein [Corallincola luteus]
MDAILVVDMQNACFDGVERYQVQNVIFHINQLTQHFRDCGLPVVHIQHEDASADFKRHSRGWQFISEVAREESDLVVAKTCCDAFIATELASVLNNYGITRLFITGCATDFCVDSTIKGAIAQRLDVVVPADAHTTADRPSVTAEILISHFNWNWAHLITAGSAIDVLPTLDAIALVKPASSVSCSSNRIGD